MTSHLLPAGFAWRRWIPLIFGTIFALTYLEWARTHLLIQLDRAAFGRETAVYSGGKRDRVDRTQCGSAGDSQGCIDSWEAAGRPPVILWFGNSQLLGINRSKPTDVSAPGQLAALLLPRGFRVVTYARPNANLSEDEITFDAIAPVYKPRVFILPVCYDDIRELQIRDDVAAFLPQGRETQQRAKTGVPVRPEPGKVATSETVQARFEDAVTREIDARWPLWSDRAGLRGTAGFAVHGLRNQMLGIHSTSKRPVDPGLYRSRMMLLDKVVGQARAQGMDVLLYVPPYRQDIAGPYVAADYDRFRKDMQAVAARHGAHYVDWTSLVPGPEWATVSDPLFGFREPDFMHFTVVGHTRLAEAVDRQLRLMGY